MKRLTLVRHGETTGQSSIRYYGITDVPLSEVGRSQMRCVGDALRAHRFDAVFTSRLCRSVEAAALITGAGTPARALTAFDEVNFGRWEGWTREEIAERDPDQYAAWQRDGAGFCYPGGDSRAAFHDRVAAGLAALLREEDGTSWLLVLHKGVIAVILTELLALSPRERADLAIDLGSIHMINQSQAGWQPAAINMTMHLLPSTQP
jgi:broad specificity phosphatase PhoE